MTPATKYWSGLLIALSVAGFVAWEVYGMIIRSRAMLGIAQAVNDPEHFEQLMEQHRSSQHDRAVQVGRIWLVALPFIAGTAFLSLGLRPEERPVGNGCVRPCSARWSPEH